MYKAGHDFRENKKKQKIRELTRKLVVENSRLLVDLDGKLLTHWIELAGVEAPSLQDLKQSGHLGGSGRFIGIEKGFDNYKSCVDRFGQQSLSHEFFNLDLLAQLEAPSDEFSEILENTGVLVFDSTHNLAPRKKDLANGKEGEMKLAVDLILPFALSQAQKLKEFLLVINGVEVGYGLNIFEKNIRKYIPDFCTISYGSIPYCSLKKTMITSIIRMGF